MNRYFTWLVPALLALMSTTFARAASPAPEWPATATWINSAPLSLAGLRGRPVLIEFWTYGCSNCRNTLPWMKKAYREFGPSGLALVAVHTPEFDWERQPAAIKRAVRELGIAYPVLLDPDYEYWNAMGNRYWPAFYLLDGKGDIVATHIGELHAGTGAAERFEARIRRLLDTSGGRPENPPPALER